MSQFKAIIKQCGVDIKAEIDGVWYDSVILPGASFKVARLGNPVYQRVLEAELRRYQRHVRAGMEIPVADRDKALNKAIAEGILIDWKNLPTGEKDENDNPTFVPFSKAAALELISTPELKDLREEIVSEANNAEKYRLQKQTEDSKN